MFDRAVSWPRIIGASLMGVCAAWLIYAAYTGIYTFTGPSNDIGIAFYPAATMIALVVAVILFWPINIVLARLGTRLAVSQPWARTWWAWAMIGGGVGAPALALFLFALSGGYNEQLWSGANMGFAIGAIAALVTHRRLQVGRYV